jgi:hypothetical protein
MFAVEGEEWICGEELFGGGARKLYTGDSQTIDG